MRLTDRAIATLAATGKRIEINDDVEAGLRLRVSPSGVKSWSLQLRTNGRKRRHTIGPYPAVSLAEARTRAKRLRLSVLDGGDPTAERRAARQAKASGEPRTLGDLIEAYGSQLRTESRYERAKLRQLRTDLAPLASTEIPAVTSADLMQIVDRKARSAPISANRLLAAIKTLSTWASSRGHLQANIAATLRKPARETPRDRVLSLSEVAVIWRATEQLGSVWEATYKLLILTAQRREEVASMRWDEIDLQRAEWLIPAGRTKNRQPHIVPLSPAAMAVLRAAQDGKGPSVYVFSTTGRTPISGFSKSKARLDELSGVTNWRIHDLRRTAVTHMAEAGVDPWVADRILNHVASSTLGTVQRVYQRSQMLNERRTALVLWADKVMQEVLSLSC